MQILLVEDDSALASGLVQALKNEDFAVNHVNKGRDAINAVSMEKPDIVILDLGLPDIDGMEVLKEVRKIESSLPVLLLTARSSIEDKIIGLDGGADDYLPKPFDMSELLARLRALGRRLSTSNTTSISISDVNLNTASHEAEVKGVLIELPRREYMLLQSLMMNAGKIQTREMLEGKLYSWGEEVSSNSIEVHIHNLRKKLPKAFIKTVRGVGYMVNK